MWCAVETPKKPYRHQNLMMMRLRVSCECTILHFIHRTLSSMTKEKENIFLLYLYLCHNNYISLDYTRTLMKGYVKRDKEVLLAQSHSDEYIYRTAPRTITIGKLRPMKADEVIGMEIDASKKNCKLEFEPGERKLYYIKKVVRPDGRPQTNLDKYLDERITMFFASLSPAFLPHFTSTGDQQTDSRYIDQIGNSYGIKGEVMYVWVNEKDEPPGKLDARNCGIAPVLMALFMVDPELNMMSRSKIKKVFRDNRELQVAISLGCKRFIGWLVQTEEEGGAYAYFSAPRRAGFKKMLIRYDHTLTPPPDDKRFKWIDVDKARDCYDHKTGWIGKKELT